MRHLWGIFFFQAEDGIRDGRVTGVQTCALPISVQGDERCLTQPAPSSKQHGRTFFWIVSGARSKKRHEVIEIGRASCRKECRSRGPPDHEKKKEIRTSTSRQIAEPNIHVQQTPT